MTRPIVIDVIDERHQRAVAWLRQAIAYAKQDGDQRRAEALEELLPGFTTWDKHRFKQILTAAGYRSEQMQKAFLQVETVMGRQPFAFRTPEQIARDGRNCEGGPIVSLGLETRRKSGE